MFKLDETRKRIVCSDVGYGFVVDESELVSTRKAGKSVVTVPEGAKLVVCERALGDRVAVVGTNRKLLIFEREELPEMTRGKGVKLQNFRGGDKLKDAMIFDSEDGLMVVEPSGRLRGFPDWEDWIGKRAQAGKPVPRGFPRSGRLNG